MRFEIRLNSLFQPPQSLGQECAWVERVGREMVGNKEVGDGVDKEEGIGELGARVDISAPDVLRCAPRAW